LLVGRWKLLLAEVDPHVVEANHQVGIAGEPHADHVEGGRDLLVRDAHVDVLEAHDVAHVLTAAIERLLRVHVVSPSLTGIRPRSPR
jgi:hypothetical protein